MRYGPFPSFSIGIWHSLVPNCLYIWRLYLWPDHEWVEIWSGRLGCRENSESVQEIFALCCFYKVASCLPMNLRSIKPNTLRLALSYFYKDASSLPKDLGSIKPNILRIRVDLFWFFSLVLLFPLLFRSSVTVLDKPIVLHIYNWNLLNSFRQF